MKTTHNGLSPSNLPATPAFNESDDRYQKLLDLLPDGVVIHAEGIIQLVNSSALRIMRATSPDELVGKPLLEFVHPDYYPIAIERHKLMLDHAEVAPIIEEKIIRCDGTEFYAETTGTVIPFAGKKAIQVVFRDVSDRIVAYEKMRISEESFRDMFENNSIAMSVIERYTYPLLEVNSAYVNLYGYTREELLGGMTARDLRPIEDVPEFERYMGQTRSSAAQMLRESTWRHVKKNGELIDVEITWSDIIFNNRSARHVLVRDITDYKRSKAALQVANERFELVTNATNDVIWDVDLSKERIWWNDNFYSKFGYSHRAEADTATWADNIHPEDKAEVLAGIKRCIEDKRTFWTDEYRYLTADKHVVTVLDRGYIQYDDHGTATRIVGAMLDITERKKYQEELRLSQSRLSTIFDSAMDAMITVDEKNLILLFNVAAERMFRCSARDIIGTSIEQFIPETFRAEHPRQLKEFGEQMEHSKEMGRSRDVYALRATGEHFPVEASISQVNSESGKLFNVILRDITEKKRAGDRLRNSEEKFRTVVQNVSDIITIVDELGIILYHSPSIKRILGYDQDETLGHSVYEFIHPDDCRKVRLALEITYLRNLVNKHIEYRILAKNGTYVVLESSGVNQAENPAVGALIVTSHDMTERKKAEDSLRQSEEKFRAIMENSNVGFSLFDQDAHVLYMSPTNERIFGYTMSELNATNPFDLIHPEDRDAIISRLHRLLQGEKVAPAEFRWLMKDGKWKWIESHAFNYLDNKSLQAILVTYQDVNERHESNTQIKNQAALLDIVPDAIITHELNGCILSWNKGAEKMYGWTAEEVIGKSIVDVLPGDKTVTIHQQLDYLYHHRKWSGDFVHLTKNNHTILVQSRWELVTNSANQHTVLVINTDITEKRSLEKQLFRAQRLESIGTLASGIAHDLNNILTPVVLGMEIIKLRAKDEAIGKRVDALIANVQRGSELIRQVLTFARGSEEKFEIINVKYGIIEVVKMALETFRKEITVQVNLPTEDLLIRGNATQLHQIILNLSINARDAMSERGGELFVEAGYVEPDEHILRRFMDIKPGKYVAITVRDTGNGIPLELQEKVFEPFFTTKEVGKGTGIGLTTVFSIVRSHGGYIDFSSQENVGTTFMIFLPAEIHQLETIEQISIQEHRQGQNKTLLFVDDEEILRTTAEDLLQEHGYTVITAKNGEEAVHLYTHHKHEIELVVTDIVMPIMNGVELIKVLFSINPKVRIIAAGGLLYDEASTSIRELGAFEVLLKPYTAKQLLVSIERVLELKEVTID